jgi:hypothetical protein
MIEEILVGLMIGTLIILFIVDTTLITLLLYKKYGERQKEKIIELNNIRNILRESILKLANEKEKLLKEIGETKQEDDYVPKPKNFEVEKLDDLFAFRQLFSKNNYRGDVI